jgi:hypothetical protein
MTVHELAGKPAPRSLLTNIPRLVTAYYVEKPDVSDPTQRVAFGTSGHRGSSCPHRGWLKPLALKARVVQSILPNTKISPGPEATEKSFQPTRTCLPIHCGSKRRL